MNQTTIQWTNCSWNPVTGCTKLSAGCKNCYAERMAKRQVAMGHNKYHNEFNLTIHENILQEPYEWKKPSLVFVPSMSDLFHKDVPLEFIQRAFNVMNEVDRHIYQVLTKRAERLALLNDQFNWTDNIWMGVSVENAKVIDRIDYLKDTSAKVKFLSCEPLIGPLGQLNLQGIDWVIVGGESGPGWRPIQCEWINEILVQCEEQNIPFFFKQWAGYYKKRSGRILNGRTYDGMPRQYAEYKSQFAA